MAESTSDRLAERICRGDNAEVGDVVDTIIADSGGDPRQVIETLVVLVRYLTRENQRLAASVSPGFMRGSGGHRA